MSADEQKTIPPDAAALAAEAAAKAEAEEAEVEAKLKADAEAAEAEARAKAEAEAVEKAKAKAPKKLSDAVLREAIAQIEARNHDLSRSGLIEELRALKGAKLDDKDNTYLVRLHGLEVTNTAGWAQALTAWCSKARRAILNGEAE